jgi:hypothetical protein
MELKRQLGISYSTAWKIKHKLIQAMRERDGQYHLQGIIHVDDAYFGGELSGGKAGRGSENKVPFVAALELKDEGRAIRLKMDRLSGRTSKAIKVWTGKRVEPRSVVFSDGLACFRATTDAVNEHVPEIMGCRKPKEVPNFQWLIAIIGNVQTSLGGTYNVFDLNKYGDRYLSEVASRFNRRFYLKGLLQRLVIACINCRPQPAHLLRSAELCC